MKKKFIQTWSPHQNSSDEKCCLTLWSQLKARLYWCLMIT